jgi:hypothetical protein
VTCPACGKALLAPYPPNDCFTWDCSDPKCGVSVPIWARINGGKMIEVARKLPDPRAFLIAVADAAFERLLDAPMA